MLICFSQLKCKRNFIFPPLFHSHFRNAKTENKEGKVTQPGSYNQFIVELDLKFRFSAFKPH